MSIVAVICSGESSSDAGCLGDDCQHDEVWFVNWSASHAERFTECRGTKRFLFQLLDRNLIANITDLWERFVPDSPLNLVTPVEITQQMELPSNLSIINPWLTVISGGRKVDAAPFADSMLRGRKGLLLTSGVLALLTLQDLGLDRIEVYGLDFYVGNSDTSRGYGEQKHSLSFDLTGLRWGLKTSAAEIFAVTSNRDIWTSLSTEFDHVSAIIV